MTRHPQQRIPTESVARGHEDALASVPYVVPADHEAKPRSSTAGMAKPAGRPERLVGKVLLGRYRIERPLASGSMGYVYEATQLPFERKVAVKVLYCNDQSDEVNQRFRKRFHREASIASQLSHPNIVTVIDYGETEEGDVFMAMEFLEGRSLQDIIHDGPVSFGRSLAIAIQIARALRRAHRSGVVHRDLKPANVMVRTEADGNELVKVLDFGLVKVFSPDYSDVSEAARENITSVGTLIGTPGYMAPEQAIGDEVDGRADLYSLGVIVFQMLTHRMPFDGVSVVELVTAQVTQRVPSLKEVDPGLDCPDMLDAIVLRCLDKSRDERFASVDELLAQLKDLWLMETEQSYGTEASMLTYLPVQEQATVRAAAPISSLAALSTHSESSEALIHGVPSGAAAPRPVQAFSAPFLAAIAVGALILVTGVAFWVTQQPAGGAPEARIVDVVAPSANDPRKLDELPGTDSESLPQGEVSGADEEDGYKDNPY